MPWQYFGSIIHHLKNCDISGKTLCFADILCMYVMDSPFNLVLHLLLVGGPQSFKWLPSLRIPPSNAIILWGLYGKWFYCGCLLGGWEKGLNFEWFNITDASQKKLFCKIIQLWTNTVRSKKAICFTDICGCNRFSCQSRLAFLFGGLTQSSKSLPSQRTCSAEICMDRLKWRCNVWINISSSIVLHRFQSGRDIEFQLCLQE